MKIFFAHSKRAITQVISKYLASAEKRLRKVNWFAGDAIRRLVPFALGGKMLRGGLVILGFSLTGKKLTKDAVLLAAAVELIHSSLVVHDDIMDMDELRRGAPTISAQYAKLAVSKKLTLPQHTGESVAVCVGDLGFFIATQLLTQVTFSGNTRKVIRLVGVIIAEVCVAQMQDVWWGRSQDTPSLPEILKMYRYKTGRYTFCLPLMMGATAGGASSSTVRQLEKLGEHLGLMFQIKDDEIGIFGSEKVTGKPVGSDIKENKKTVWQVMLSQRASVSERNKLKTIFGAPKVTQKNIQYIQGLIEKRGVRKYIDKLQQGYASKAQKLIQTLKASSESKRILSELVEYNLKREA